MHSTMRHSNVHVRVALLFLKTDAQLEEASTCLRNVVCGETKEKKWFMQRCIVRFDMFARRILVRKQKVKEKKHAVGKKWGYAQ